MCGYQPVKPSSSLSSASDGEHSPGRESVTRDWKCRDDGCWRLNRRPDWFKDLALPFGPGLHTYRCFSVQPPLCLVPLGRLGGSAFGLIQVLAPSAHRLHAPARTLEPASQRTNHVLYQWKLSLCRMEGVRVNLRLENGNS